MRLLSLTLNGQYKGLRDQHFDFTHTQGNILALIGLNGSGKSQLLELIAETFAYLERWQRTDFKTKTALGFGVTVCYQYDIRADTGVYAYHDSIFNNNGIVDLRITTTKTGRVYIAVMAESEWLDMPHEKAFPLPNIVGYSSGLNENLQRGFMKNAVQYHDVIRTRLSRKKALSADLNDEQISEINTRYLNRNPHIFQSEDRFDGDRGFLLALQEAQTSLSKCIYLDYNSASLVVAALALLSPEEINFLPEGFKFRYPQKLVLQYDLRGDLAGLDEVHDIQLLIRVAGSANIQGIGQRTTDGQYELYGLDYMAGLITLDLSNASVVDNLREASYNDPANFFRRLYKIQQLGIKHWQGIDRKRLRKDDFMATVKKPLKYKLPLLVVELVLSDGCNEVVDFDDLSDGEAQLIQTMAASHIFGREPTLFLFDEPETHLNPSWKTYFHSYLSRALIHSNQNNSQTQVLLSTHSPFMISSLKQEDVFFFQRNDDDLVNMMPVDGQTYGASFEVLIKNYFGLRSLISQTVVETVKDHLPKNDLPESMATAREWIERNLGDSMEKAYILRKLQG